MINTTIKVFREFYFEQIKVTFFLTAPLFITKMAPLCAMDNQQEHQNHHRYAHSHSFVVKLLDETNENNALTRQYEKNWALKYYHNGSRIITLFLENTPCLNIQHMSNSRQIHNGFDIDIITKTDPGSLVDGLNFSVYRTITPQRGFRYTLIQAPNLTDLPAFLDRLIRYKEIPRNIAQDILNLINSDTVSAFDIINQDETLIPGSFEWIEAMENVSARDKKYIDARRALAHAYMNLDEVSIPEEYVNTLNLGCLTLSLNALLQVSYDKRQDVNQDIIDITKLYFIKDTGEQSNQLEKHINAYVDQCAPMLSLENLKLFTNALFAMKGMLFPHVPQ